MTVLIFARNQQKARQEARQRGLPRDAWMYISHPRQLQGRLTGNDEKVFVGAHWEHPLAAELRQALAASDLHTPGAVESPESPGAVQRS